MAVLSDPRPVVVAVGGPTATGKTALAVALAKRFGGEVLSADSMQIYKGLDIGTAKATPEEQGGVPHHLLDIVEPETPFSVADFTARADGIIRALSAAGKLPIVAGGTGLYITNLLAGTAFAPEKTDPDLRAALEARAKTEGGPAALFAELQAADPDYAAAIHPNNLPRVIRGAGTVPRHRPPYERGARRHPGRKPRPTARSAWRLATVTGKPFTAALTAGWTVWWRPACLKRARRVYAHRATYRTAAQAIGYKEFFPYFEGKADLASCTAALKQASRRYAKRQLTWFRHQGEATWLYLDEPRRPAGGRKGGEDCGKVFKRANTLIRSV